MFNKLRHLFKLARAGRTIARHGGLDAALDDDNVPSAVKSVLRLLGAGKSSKEQRSGLAEALNELGPSYIKLGQFLATRPDMIGTERAGALRQLQDRMKPFDMNEAREAIQAGLGQPAGEIFQPLSDPVAAASIAQVHKAQLVDEAGNRRDVAVKVLRPGVEARFRKISPAGWPRP
ncbi:MAG: AarF/UbiB family protein, partial [Pseudomonadota bacterium]